MIRARIERTFPAMSKSRAIHSIAAVAAAAAALIIATIALQSSGLAPAMRA